jgi:hypothetical protein
LVRHNICRTLSGLFTGNFKITITYNLAALYRDRKNLPHTTGQILRRTLLAPGPFQGLLGQGTGRLLRRVTPTNFIAVPLVVMHIENQKPKTNEKNNQ